MENRPASAPRRLSREESAAQTRELLLESARAVFVERGYQDSSIYEIAERAGRTIGALYSHFGGKEGVFLALWDRHFAEVLDRYGALLADAQGSSEQLPPGTAGDLWTQLLGQDPEIFRLFIEFWSHALREPELRPRFAQALRQLHTAIAAIVENYQQSFGLPLSVSASEVATVIEALVDGFSLHKLADPDRIDDSLLSRAFTWLAVGLVADTQRPARPARVPGDAGVPSGHDG
jgi:AcrR family transcriptional regulator